jgi:hypothetical protein
MGSEYEAAATAYNDLYQGQTDTFVQGAMKKNQMYQAQ